MESVAACVVQPRHRMQRMMLPCCSQGPSLRRCASCAGRSGKPDLRLDILYMFPNDALISLNKRLYQYIVVPTQRQKPPKLMLDGQCSRRQPLVEKFAGACLGGSSHHDRAACLSQIPPLSSLPLLDTAASPKKKGQDHAQRLLAAPLDRVKNAPDNRRFDHRRRWST